jgi:PAS domain S-box-containing protein
MPADDHEQRERSWELAYEQIQAEFRRQAEELRNARKELRDQAQRHAADLKRLADEAEARMREQQQIAEALRASEERYRSLIELAPDSIATLDLRGRITSTNAAACGISGYELDEALGKPFWKLGVFRARDIPKYLKLFCSLIRGKPPGPLELECYSKDGTQQVLESRVGFIRENGRIAGLQVISRNITQRKRQEELLAKEQAFRNSIIEHASEGLCVCHVTPGSPYLAVTIWNRRMTDLTGYTMEEINRLGWYQTVYPDPELRDKAIQRVAAASEGDDLVDEEWEITRADGDRRCVLISTSVVAVEGETKHVLALMHDITDAKRAREALKASEENFRTFFNSVDECLFVMNKEGRVLYINDTAATKLGYSQEELSGKSVLCLPPENRREEAGRIVADMAAGRVATCPIPMLTKDGRLIPVETRVVKGRWNGQEVAFGISKDLSELRASEERFSKAFHGSPSPMAITSLVDHRLLDVNDSLLQTLGYEREEAIGATTTELGIFADQTQRTAALALLNERGTLRDFEVDVRTKSGEIRHGLFSGEFIQLQDQPVLLTVMNDITERKRAEGALRASEERCRLLVDSIPQMAWRSSPDGLSIDCNRRWFEYTGQNPSQVNAHGWLAAVHTDDLFRVTQKTIQGAITREPYDIEYRLRRASDGSYRWHLARLIPVFGEDGEVTCWFGTATDIEDIKRAQEILKMDHEEQLQKHRAELAHAARLSMMGEMAATLAHELNQPLHAVRNYAQGGLMRLEKSSETDEELVVAMQQIAEEANRAAAIVRRIRRFVQKREPHRFEVPLNGLVEGIVVLTKAELEQRHIKVALELSEDHPIVIGDPVQIEQVILNLVRNALEAMEETPEENRRLAIKTARNADGMVLVEVRDCGQGINQQDVKKVFEPFYSTKREGMGMGLAISQSIVREHGGRLWLSQNQDHGCTFHFTLPGGKGSD